MNYDEFAFINQQLAGMLRSGIPLEGALRQLCTTMDRGSLQREFSQLEADLAQGVPLDKALAARQLPSFYVAMIRVGVRGGDLPSVLTLVADHYQRQNSVLTRLKGLMAYPVIVLLVALALSLALGVIVYQVVGAFPTDLGFNLPPGTYVTLWIAPTTLALALAALIICLRSARCRKHLRWWLPGCKEASLAQIASSLALLLQGGTPLTEAIQLMRECEGDSPASRELAQWQARLAQGNGKAATFAAGGQVFPPLFIWLTDNAGEDLASGFSRAAAIYHGRAMFRMEMLLYACLPVSVILLGIMIIGEVYPVLAVFRSITTFMD